MIKQWERKGKGSGSASAIANTPCKAGGGGGGGVWMEDAMRPAGRPVPAFGCLRGARGLGWLAGWLDAAPAPAPRKPLPLQPHQAAALHLFLPLGVVPCHLLTGLDRPQENASILLHSAACQLVFLFFLFFGAMRSQIKLENTPPWQEWRRF
jgi:hypothetical protein